MKREEARGAVIFILGRENMKAFLSVAGPITGNFILWYLISFLPVHPVISFVLVMTTVVLMLYGITYFREMADRGK